MTMMTFFKVIGSKLEVTFSKMHFSGGGISIDGTPSKTIWITLTPKLVFL